MSRRTKAEIERERAEKDQLRRRREWLRKERSKPRTELPSAYAGETVHVHQRILDAFMKQVGKKIDIDSYKVEGGTGGKLVIRYTTRFCTHGTLELNDLGPMPTT